MTSNEPAWNHGHVEANGMRVHYVRQGTGEPLVLLHGWPEFWYVWRKNIGPLSEPFDVIAPDLRGFGLSEKSGLPAPRAGCSTSWWRTCSVWRMRSGWRGSA